MDGVLILLSSFSFTHFFFCCCCCCLFVIRVLFGVLFSLYSLENVVKKVYLKIVRIFSFLTVESS